MLSSPVFWVSLVLLLLVVIGAILYNTPRAKAARKRRAEEYRQQEEKREAEEKAEVARKAQRMENFRKQRITVYIREKDGRKSSFEAVLIRMLLKSGIAVEPLPESNGRSIAGGDTSSLKDGLLALVGTSWHKNSIVSGTEDGFAYEYELDRAYCDYRLLVASDAGNGKILGAGCGSCIDGEDILANSIIMDLASTVPITPEVN